MCVCLDTPVQILFHSRLVRKETADISGLTTLPLEQLRALREEYAAAEQAAFAALQQQAAAWEEQAGKTLAIDKAIEYVRTPEVKHTANQWEAADYGKHISNRVYQMRAAYSSRNARNCSKGRVVSPEMSAVFSSKYTLRSIRILSAGSNRSCSYTE